MPSAEVRTSKAQLTVTVAETYDVEFVSPTPQELRFDLLLPAQKIHRTQTLVFNPATQESRRLSDRDRQCVFCWPGEFCQ